MANSAEKIWPKLLANRTVGGFTIGEYIGGGNFGLVFSSEDSSGREIALKILTPGHAGSEEPMLDFLRESQLLTSLRKSSNVVDILASGTDQVTITTSEGIPVPLGLNYMALEMADRSLEALITARDEISWADRLLLWRGAVLGIHQMHLRGIVHRDIKSDNCLLFLRPKNAVDCKVADLGRSRNTTEPAMHPREKYIFGRGDLRFAPPEFLWLQGDDSAVSHKQADLYGLGSLLFEVAVGQGITAMALGSGPQIIQENMRDQQAQTYTDLSALIGAYTPAIELFSDSVPLSIRKTATSLLQQLCHPVPEKRLPKQGIGKRRISDPGIGWLLNKADILVKSVSIDRARGKHLSRR